MPVSLAILLALCLVGMFFCLFMLMRNEWVGRQRQHIIQLASAESKRRIPSRGGDFLKPFEEYETLYMTYDEMMHRFWIWDLRRLTRGEVPDYLIPESLRD